MNRSPLARVRRFLLLIAGAYAAVMLLVYCSQSSLLYHPDTPSREYAATPEKIGLAYDPVTIVAEDGVELDGWFVPVDRPRGVVLFFHGNAGNISHRLASLKIFNRLGLSTLIIDYRGFGRSQGEVSEAGTYRDAEAAWRYLIERKFPARRIVVFGRSLGAAIAARLAARHAPAAVILESAFTSVPDIAARLYWFLPVRWLARFRYDTKAYLATVRRPVLIVHSPDDEIIPFDNGRALFAAANEPKRFLKIRGSHNQGFLLSGKTYIDGLDAFLTKHLGDAD